MPTNCNRTRRNYFDLRKSTPECSVTIRSMPGQEGKEVVKSEMPDDTENAERSGIPEMEISRNRYRICFDN